MIKRYRLDPDNPPQLTREEARRLDETPIDYSDIPPLDQIDWSQCPDVESVPGRCSGQPVVKGTRVIVESCILDNADRGCSAEEIADQFAVPVDTVRRILAYAAATTDDDQSAYYFSGEDELSALLLAMVIDHCGSPSPEHRRTMTSYFSRDSSPDRWLDSYGISTHADAMVALHEQGLIEITEQDGPRLAAKVTDEGRTLLDHLHREQQRNAAAHWQRYDGTLPRYRDD